MPETGRNHLGAVGTGLVAATCLGIPRENPSSPPTRHGGLVPKDFIITKTAARNQW
jgi:hypothetical protein